MTTELFSSLAIATTVIALSIVAMVFHVEHQILRLHQRVKDLEMHYMHLLSGEILVRRNECRSRMLSLQSDIGDALKSSVAPDVENIEWAPACKESCPADSHEHSNDKPKP
jgi:hypothetical protein